MIILILSLLLLSGLAPAPSAACNHATDLKWITNDYRWSLQVDNAGCVQSMQCGQLHYPGLGGDVCPFQSFHPSNGQQFFAYPLLLPGAWTGNHMKFDIGSIDDSSGSSLITNNLQFNKYFPDYSLKKTVSRIDENNEFYGLEIFLYKEDGSSVVEGEKLEVSKNLTFISVARNLPSHMTSSINSLQLVAQNEDAKTYTLWNNGFPFSGCTTCESYLSKVGKMTEAKETSFPEFADTMFNSTSVKIQIKAKISVTACGTSRRKCRPLRVINNPSGMGPPAGKRTRSKRSVDQPKDTKPVQVDERVSSNVGRAIKTVAIERPVSVDYNEKIQISFRANVVLLTTYFVVINYITIRYNPMKY